METFPKLNTKYHVIMAWYRTGPQNQRPMLDPAV